MRDGKPAGKPAAPMARHPARGMLEENREVNISKAIIFSLLSSSLIIFLLGSYIYEPSRKIIRRKYRYNL